MPRNEHRKEVIYESFDGKKTIYATGVNWKENQLVVMHYPDYNGREYLHEDEPVKLHPDKREIPLERVYEVNDINQ